MHCLKRGIAGAHLAEVVRLSPPGSAAPASAPLASLAAAASAAAGVPPEAGRAFSGRSDVAVEQALPSAAAPWLAVCASRDPPGSSGEDASARHAQVVGIARIVCACAEQDDSKQPVHLVSGKRKELQRLWRYLPRCAPRSQRRRRGRRPDAAARPQANRALSVCC